MHTHPSDSHASARRLADERGANLVEYILLVALIAIAVIGAVLFVRGQINRTAVKAGIEVACADYPDEECDDIRTIVDHPDVDWVNPGG